MTATREIEQKIGNGCAHRWMPVWWKPESWLARRLGAERQERYQEAGYRKAFKCDLGCGLAYLAKTGAVVTLTET